MASIPPPVNKLLPGVIWANRQVVPGASVLPGQQVNLVYGLERTSNATTSTAGVVVLYHDGRTRYEPRTNLKVVIKNRCF